MEMDYSPMKFCNSQKNYPKLCKGCSSGNHIISSGLELINIGLIEKKIAKGGFKWYLKNINQE